MAITLTSVTVAVNGVNYVVTSSAKAISTPCGTNGMAVTPVSCVASGGVAPYTVSITSGAKVGSTGVTLTVTDSTEGTALTASISGCSFTESAGYAERKYIQRPTVQRMVAIYGKATSGTDGSFELGDNENVDFVFDLKVNSTSLYAVYDYTAKKAYLYDSSGAKASTTFTYNALVSYI